MIWQTKTLRNCVDLFVLKGVFYRKFTKLPNVKTQNIANKIMAIKYENSGTVEKAKVLGKQPPFQHHPSLLHSVEW